MDGDRMHEVVLNGVRYVTKRTVVNTCSHCEMHSFCGKNHGNKLGDICSNLVSYDTYFIRKENDDGERGIEGGLCRGD